MRPAPPVATPLAGPRLPGPPISAGLLLSALLGTPLHAATSASFEQHDGIAVIVDHDLPIAEPVRSPFTPDRPILDSHATLIAGDGIGNVRIECRLDAPCGTSVAHFRVIYLDADGALAPQDELVLLAHLATTTRIQVGSERARRAVLEAFARSAITSAPPLEIRAFDACSGACDARIVLRCAAL